MWCLLSAGSNAQGQLGNASIDDSHTFQACSFANASPGTLPPNTNDVLDVANGANHTLLLLEIAKPCGLTTTEIWGCGDGKNGQLGPDYRKRSNDEECITIFQKLSVDSNFDTLGLGGYTIKAIGATWETSYAVVTKMGKKDAIVSFGSNDFGDLGIGRDAENQVVERGQGVHIVNFSHVSVDGKLIQSANSVMVEKLRTGQRHVIASLNVVWNDQEPIQILVGWGACRHGQLGESPASNSLTRRSLPSGKAKKSPVQRQATYYSQPVLVWASTTSSARDLIIDYSLGIHHSVFLHAFGYLSSRGSNRKRQTEGLDNLRNAQDAKCTWNGTCVLTSDEPQKVMSTGSNSHGQLGRIEDEVHSLQVTRIPVLGANIKALACGSEHSLVCLSVDGKGDEVWGWGWNEHGNLGLGNTVDSPIPQRVWPQSDVCATRYHVRSIWGGNGSSWILCRKFDSL